MKKARKKKTVVVIALAVLLLSAYLFYSRPMTVSQLYPMLTLDKCIGISGYHHDTTQTGGFTQFTIEPNSEEYQELCSLLYGKTYRRSLRDLLPRGTRTHQTGSEFEFQWEVIFHFDTIEFPDGATGSGTLLRIQYWYGELDIHFDGEIYSCYTDAQEAWAGEILDTIQQK